MLNARSAFTPLPLRPYLAKRTSGFFLVLCSAQRLDDCDFRSTNWLGFVAGVPWLTGSYSRRCTTTAANLGALQAARIAGTRVPDGFCIPFSHYERFMRANGLAE